MEQELLGKLKDVVEIVEKNLTNPDIELGYSIPDDTETKKSRNASSDAYIELTYIPNGTHTMKQKIPIKEIYFKKTPQDIANLVTFYIEQFIEQIDSVENGAQ